MRRLYSLFMCLLLPVLCLRLLWKSRLAPAYRRRISERFSFFYTIAPVDVLVHAVSLGEVIAASPLIEALLAKGFRVAVTTLTPTGSARVTAQFSGRVMHVYLPFDVLFFQRRLLKKLSPKVCVIMETELWPNFIYACHQQGVPVGIVNARLSVKSAKGYQKIRWLLSPLLQQLDFVLAQSAADGERFLSLGLSTKKLSSSGNIKFDIVQSDALLAKAKDLEQRFGNRPVWIAASTHPGEELAVLRAFHELKARLPRLLLIIAPRHPERFAPVADLVVAHDRVLQRRSDGLALDDNCEVLLLDSLGELMLFYAASDVAFVGGSLVAHGGHNVLEPIAVATAVVTGRHTHNFKAIIEGLLQQGGISIVDEKNLAKRLATLLTDSAVRTNQIRAAKQVLRLNQGGLVRTLDEIESRIARG